MKALIARREDAADALQKCFYLSSLYHLAENQQLHKQFAEAIESLTAILQADCNDKCVYEERGKAYLLNENYAEALRDFEMVASFG